MLALQGHFEGYEFVPTKKVSIPGNRKAIVTILDEPIPETMEREKQAWLKFLAAIAASNEDVEGEPERTNIIRAIDL